MVASTRAYSMSGSSETASNNRCQTPAFTQSRKRVKMLFQWPNEGGRSRHGLPVRTTHKTASTNRRLFLPLRPGSPGLPQCCSLCDLDGGGEVDAGGRLWGARSQRVVAHLALDAARHLPASAALC